MSTRSSAVLGAAAIGAVGALLGVASCLHEADHLFWLNDGNAGHLSAEVVTDIAGRAVLVIAMTLSCLVFALPALAFARGGGTVAQLGAIGGANALVFVTILVSKWKVYQDGWYYALDPHGQGIVILFVITAALQPAAWLVAAVLARRPA